MEKTAALAFIEKNKINIDNHKSVIVTSDNAVYLDSEIDPIANHCIANGKTFFVVKSDSREPVKEAEEKKTPETPKKKGKKQS